MFYDPQVHHVGDEQGVIDAAALQRELEKEITLRTQDQNNPRSSTRIESTRQSRLEEQKLQGPSKKEKKKKNLRVEEGPPIVRFLGRDISLPFKRHDVLIYLDKNESEGSWGNKKKCSWRPYWIGIFDSLRRLYRSCWPHLPLHLEF